MEAYGCIERAKLRQILVDFRNSSTARLCSDFLYNQVIIKDRTTLSTYLWTIMWNSFTNC